MDKTADSSGKKKQDHRKKNKRKFSDPSSAVHTDELSSVNAFPLYHSSNVGPEKASEEAEEEIHELDEWKDAFANQIEELALSTLRVIFLIALKQIAECGYGEDLAEKALSRKGLYMAEGDAVSNIVQDTLNILKGKDVPSPVDIAFESFQQMVNYTLVELISVLREVRPSLTAGDAMWLLLICDYNVPLALTMEIESSATTSKNSSVPEIPVALASPGVKHEMKKSEECVSTSKGKSETSAKKKPNRKENVSLRQQFLQMEKTCKVSGKGRFKSGKLKDTGSLVLMAPSTSLKNGS